MKEFGEKFSSYTTLGVSHLSMPDTKISFDELSRLGVKIARDQMAEIKPTGPFALGTTKSRASTLRVLGIKDISDRLKEELKKIIIQVAPTSNVYQIPPDQPGLSDSVKGSLKYYDFYLTELGLNVSVGREAKITSLLCNVDLKTDAEQRADVTAYDVMPKDEIKNIKIIGGKVSLGISSLLKLVPGQIGQVLSNLLSIDINPWEFSWNFQKYQIDTSGPKNWQIYWHLYGTTIAQGFNPTLILKVRKGVTKVNAAVRIVYQLQTGYLSSKQVRTDQKIVPILPP